MSFSGDILPSHSEMLSTENTEQYPNEQNSEKNGERRIVPAVPAANLPFVDRQPLPSSAGQPQQIDEAHDQSRNGNHAPPRHHIGKQRRSGQNSTATHNAPTVANRSTHISLKARSSFRAHLPIFSLIALPIFRTVCRNGQADIDTLLLLLGQFRRRIDILIITIDDRRQLFRSIP